MNKIEFITWTTLWQTSPTTVFTILDSQGILDYSTNGTSVSDIFFNDAEYAYWEIVLDLSTIQAYLSGLTNPNPYSPVEPYTQSPYDIYELIWKYGVRLYKDNTLLFTGIVFLDSININETRHTFKFTATSFLGALKRVNQTSDIIPGSPLYTLNPVGDQIRELYNEACYYLLGTATKPELQNAVGLITLINSSISYALPNYNNDFADWESGVSVLTDDYLQDSIISIGFYPPVSGGGSNIPTIFMLKTWRRFSNNVYFIAFKMRVYQFSAYAPLTPYQVINIDYNNTTSQLGGLYQIIDAYLPNSEQYISHQTSTVFTMPPNAYVNYSISLGSDGSTWGYVGDFNMSEIKINEDVTSINYFDTMIDLAYLRQQMPINDPYGNVVFTTRPPLVDTLSATSVSNLIVDDVVRGSVYMKPVKYQNQFDYLNDIDNISRFFHKYNTLVASMYKIKIYLTYDGFPTLEIGNKIRYNGHDYIISAIRPDYLNYRTFIEAYGEV